MLNERITRHKEAAVKRQCQIDKKKRKSTEIVLFTFAELSSGFQ